MSFNHKRYAHIASGLMMFSTILSVIAPTANTVSANKVNHNNQDNTDTEKGEHVGQNSLANRKASLKQMAGFSTMQGYNFNSSASSQGQSNNDDLVHFASSATSTSSASSDASTSSNASSASSSAVTEQITVNYEYGNTVVGEKTYNVEMGKSMDTSQMPNELVNHYKVVDGTSVKVDTPTSMNFTVHVVPSSASSNQNGMASSGQSSQASSASASASKPTPTPLPSRQYTDNRKQVVNPMFRPNNAERISNPSEFKPEVTMNSNDTPRDMSKIKPYKNFSKSVLRYKPYMDKTVKHYHVKNYETLLLAIMECETHGQGSDVMQSSESLGLSPNSLDPQQSIEQATRYMAKIVQKAKSMDNAEQSNKKFPKRDYHYYANDNRLLAQTYNYGGNFLDYVAKNKSGYNLSVSEKYSRDVVAPLLGNTNGSTYGYDNPISNMYHKKYLYVNGGNYFYGDMTEQYAVNGYMHTILNRLIKYSGQKYVFGGKTPKQGFDCSGLTSYAFKLLGVHLPSYTVTQWHKTKAVKGGVNNAKPGDLVFFKGTYGGKDFISHVGLMVDRHTMFDADSNGVGFHSLDNAYWRKHYAGVRRIPQAHKLNHRASLSLSREVRQAINEYK